MGKGFKSCVFILLLAFLNVIAAAAMSGNGSGYKPKPTFNKNPIGLGSLLVFEEDEEDRIEDNIHFSFIPNKYGIENIHSSYSLHRLNLGYTQIVPNHFPRNIVIYLRNLRL